MYKHISLQLPGHLISYKGKMVSLKSLAQQKAQELKPILQKLKEEQQRAKRPSEEALPAERAQKVRKTEKE